MKSAEGRRILSLHITVTHITHHFLE